jgi:4,5-dihydroxyphthalate decarboxylase
MNSQSPIMLHSLLGNYANNAAVKSGRISSPLVKFDFFEVKVANAQFKAMVRDLKYDFGELAIVTFLQAKIYGKPGVLLPATIVGRNQHQTIFYNAVRGHLSPRDLNGKRVGVRAYTQTTGTWIRGILSDDYGVDLNSVTWITYEAPHIAEYTDPPNVQRAPEGKTIKQMLIDGEIDAAILGDVEEEGPIKHLIPDHEAAACAWAKSHGGVPVNHLAVVRESIAMSRPEEVRELYRMLKESREISGIKAGEENPLRFGFAAVSPSVRQIASYALDQKLIPKLLTPEEMFADARRVLGAAGE